MLRLARLLWGHIWSKFLTWMGLRAFLITLVLEQAVTPLLGLAVWSAALPESDGVSTYYVALFVVQLMTVSYEAHTLSNGIYAGALSHELVKPQPPVLGTLGENLAMRIWHLLIGLPLILITGFITGVSFDADAVLLAIPAILLAAAIRFLFIYTLALSAFWTEQAHGTVGFGETLIFLLGGSAAPIAFFPEPLRPLGEALPFRAMLGFPAEIASGSLSGTEMLTGYGWQALWLAAFTVIAVVVWQQGVRRYTAVGG